MAARLTHLPVLKEEVLHWLRPTPGGAYWDGTVGAGGHSLALLDAVKGNARLFASDRDEAMLAQARETLQPYASQVTWFHGTFGEAVPVAKEFAPPGFDGILLDLGISSVQLDDPLRGLSFLQEGPLDMRLDRRQDTTAADLVNGLPEEDLANIIYAYGEERMSRKIARAVVLRRKARPFITTTDLAALVASVVYSPPQARIHPATRTFQALRIAVNNELDPLKEEVRTLAGMLAPGGRLLVISFHSLEDRPVKEVFRELAPNRRDSVSDYRLPVRKPLTATPEEIQDNPRSRSAKLRILERKVGEEVEGL